MRGTLQQSAFGTLPDGTAVDLFTLTNANGSIARITNYGTIITSLEVPDRKKQLGDVVLGFDNLQQYLDGHPYFGCTVGRFANRIAKGRFVLDDVVYTLAVNNGPNALHGGLKGFDKVVWKAEPQEGAAVQFTYRSVDGEEGYPGNLDVTVQMSLADANELRIDYTAVTDKPTPINLTNHSYFNLACSGDILGHEVMIDADKFTPVDGNSIPTGDIVGVRGTAMDFTAPQIIGGRFDQLGNHPVGYDNNFVLNSGGGGLALAARVYEAASGRLMEVYTTEPGVQLYTSNYFDGSLKGKGGRVYGQHAALCLETQHFPDSVNKPQFPSAILRPGQIYRQTTIYKFSVE